MGNHNYYYIDNIGYCWIYICIILFFLILSCLSFPYRVTRWWSPQTRCRRTVLHANGYLIFLTQFEKGIAGVGRKKHMKKMGMIQVVPCLLWPVHVEWIGVCVFWIWVDVNTRWYPARVWAEISKIGSGHRKSTAYRKGLAMQKQWNVEVVPCINKWANWLLR